MTLTEFLLARLDETETVARRAGGQQWLPTPALLERMAPLHEDDAAHMLRHDPARVLAECDAQRRIVELHSGGNDERCQSWNGNYVVEPCETLRALALPHAAHPDYDESWRP